MSFFTERLKSFLHIGLRNQQSCERDKNQSQNKEELMSKNNKQEKNNVCNQSFNYQQSTNIKKVYQLQNENCLPQNQYIKGANVETEVSERDFDQDSLGYTQNQWDQQTINFQLEDRMLDCLQNEKHVSQYRQSLMQIGNLRKKNSNRNTVTINQCTNSVKFQAGVQEKTLQTERKQELFDIITLNEQKQLIKNSKGENNQSGKNQKQSIIQHRKMQLQQIKKKNRFQKYLNKKDNQQKQKNFKKNELFDQITKSEGRFQKYERLISQTYKLNCQEYINKVFDINKQSIQKNDNYNYVNKNLTIQKQNNLNNSSNIQNPAIVSQGHFLQTQNKKDPTLNQNALESQQSFEVKEQNKTFIFQQSEGDIIENQKQAILASLDKRVTFKNQPLQSNQRLFFKNMSPQKTVQEEKILKIDKHQNKYHVLTPPKNFSLIEQGSYNNSSSTKVALYQSRQKNIQQYQKKADQIEMVKQLQIPIIYSPVKENQSLSQKMIIRFNYQSKSQMQNKELRQEKKQEDSQILVKKGQICEKITLIKDNQKERKINFSYSSNQQSKEKLLASPRAKIQSTQQQTQNTRKEQNDSSPQLSQCKQQTLPVQTKFRQFYMQAQPQERIPIFLQRLRRLDSVYPNFYAKKQINQNKILMDLQQILNTMKSSLTVIQLLYKKLCILKHKLHQPLIKIVQSLKLTSHQQNKKDILQDQIFQFFMNQSWKYFKIQEIHYIQPKQRFQKRPFISTNFENALKNFTHVVNHYCSNLQMNLKTSQGKQRYVRIRQKICLIEKNLKLMSEDLYTFWLFQCNYPYLYQELIDFLKQQNTNKDKQRMDEILAKLVQKEETGDLVSLSIIGRKVQEKIRRGFE